MIVTKLFCLSKEYTLLEELHCEVKHLFSLFSPLTSENPEQKGNKDPLYLILIYICTHYN